MNADTTAILKKDEKNPMNMTTTVGKHRIGKGDRWKNVRWNRYVFFAHPMSMITTVGKDLLGNGDRW